jgi:hypothetical protein
VGQGRVFGTLHESLAAAGIVGHEAPSLDG